MLNVNDLIKWVDHEIVERVLWSDGILVALIEIKDENALPYLKRVSEINKAFEKFEVKKIFEDPYIRIVDEEELSATEKSIREKSWETIKPLVHEDNEPAIYYRSSRGRLIESIIKDKKSTKKTIYKILRRYWQRGKTKNALIPDYNKSGGRGKTKKVGLKKRGRPRKYDNSFSGVNIDEKAREIFRKTFKKYYLTDLEDSIAKVHTLMIRDYYSEKIDSGEYPSLTQFKYWCEKESDNREVIIARKGLRKYNNEFRPSLGTATSEVIGPGSRYIIDSTPDNINLISRLDEEQYIGRPIVYIVKDVFSRMVVGLYVGLENPSKISAAMAIYNSARNKVNFCAEYDLQINEDDWPCIGLPDVFLADNGELAGKTIEVLSNSLNVRIENAGPYRPTMKGVGEKHFDIFQEFLKTFIPGHIGKDSKQRGSKDYRKEAKINIFQYTQALILHTIKFNKSHVLKSYKRNEDMIQDHVKQIPLELWNWGIVNRSGKLHSYPDDVLKLNLMPIQEALITQKGIKFNKMFYGCQLAFREKWFDKASIKGTEKIKVSYDPRNVNYIYIRHENDYGYEKCYLLDGQDQDYCLDKTLDEIILITEQERNTQKTLEREELKADVDLINNLVEIRKKSSKNTGHIKLDGSKESRKKERDIIRNKEAFNIGEESNNIPGKVIPLKKEDTDDNPYPKNLDLLKKIREEKLNEKNTSE